MDQPKLERLLRLMKMLTANTEYTIDDLAERLMMSRRTVYRYIDTFREAGFVIKKSGEHIRLDKESPHFKDISQLIHFTEEEAVILKSAIENIDDDNLLKQNLKRKLYSVYDNRTLADTIVKGRLSGIVHNLVGAIAEKRQVVLQAYRSASPPTTSTSGATTRKTASASSSKPRASAPYCRSATNGRTKRNTAKVSWTSSA